MSNTEKSVQRSALSAQLFARRRKAVLYCLLLTAYCLLATGCRMDMQDQPKYKTYRAGDQKYGVQGASVRPLVEGTVPRRGSGAEYRDKDDYLYTGQTGATSGGAAAPSMPAAMPVSSTVSQSTAGA